MERARLVKGNDDDDDPKEVNQSRQIGCFGEMIRFVMGFCQGTLMGFPWHAFGNWYMLF
jgi:hypothetical protein